MRSDAATRRGSQRKWPGTLMAAIPVKCIATPERPRNAPPRERGEAVRRGGRRREADARAGDGDEQREAGERRIVADVVAGVEGQHGDEVGGPDGRARRHCTEEEPPGPGCAAALETLASQRHGGGCTGDADERRHQHELGIVSQQDV